MNEEEIKYMVNRFLGWKLPENFSPDAGISFKADYNEDTAWPAKHRPTGTNLFDATQATEMIRYLVDGMDEVTGQSATDKRQVTEPVEIAPATPHQKLRQTIERLVGTAILKNDKNYTYDFMQAIDTYIAELIGEDEFPPDETLAFKQVKVYSTYRHTTRNALRAELRDKAGL